jgi:hypothetical protein
MGLQLFSNGKTKISLKQQQISERINSTFISLSIQNQYNFAQNSISTK